MKTRRTDASYAFAYFVLYCKARRLGFKDDEARLLGYIRELGFDVEDKDGKWGLVKKEK